MTTKVKQIKNRLQGFALHFLLPIIFLLLLGSASSRAQVKMGAAIDGAAAGYQFGFAVAMSADGQRFAIGAPYNDSGAKSNDDSGLVRVYDWNGNGWTKAGQDMHGDFSEDELGASVALSADGQTLAIGAPQHSGSYGRRGQVKVYRWNGSTNQWTQTGGDIDGEARNDALGTAVALSSDGNRIAIGAPGNDANGNNAGHARVYDWSGSEWKQVGGDIDGEAAEDWFGFAVAISNKGQRLAIGAPDHDNSKGHARVYDWNGSAWTRLGADIDGEMESDNSGTSVALSADGKRLAIGAPYNDGNGRDAGHVRVYDWSGSAWTQVGTDIDGEVAEDQFGFAVAMSANGEQLVISAPFHDDSKGHVRVYDWSGSAWTQVGTDIDGAARRDTFGTSVAMSANGEQLGIGTSDKNSATGQVQMYTFADPPGAPQGQAAQVFCEQKQVKDLSAVGEHIQWYDQPTGGTALDPNQDLESKTYYATQTVGGIGSAQRLAVEATVVLAPKGAAAQTHCTGEKVSELQATGTGIQWYAANTGGTALAPNTALADGSTYYASQTVSGCTNTQRLAVVVTLTSVIPQAPTADAQQSLCSGEPVSALQATGADIQWYAAATGGNRLDGATALVDGSTYHASQTVGCESTGRVPVTVTLKTLPQVPTGEPAQGVCTASGAAPTIAKLKATGASIQWYEASTGGKRVDGTTTLANGKTYYASQTVNGCESTGRFATTVTLNDAMPDAPKVAATSQTFCPGTKVSALQATGTGIQWYDASTGGNRVDGDTDLKAGGGYYGTQTVNGCESKGSGNAYVYVSLSIPSDPMIAKRSQIFCPGAKVSALQATGTDIKWYTMDKDGNYRAVDDDVDLVQRERYFPTQTVNGCESYQESNGVSVYLDNPPDAPTGQAAQGFCIASGATPTIAKLKAPGEGIQWYDAAKDGDRVDGTTALASGKTYYASQTVGCESADRLAVTVTLNRVIPDAPTGTAQQVLCTAGGAATIATGLKVTGTAINWYDAETGGHRVAGTTALASGKTYYASQTVNGCESTGRFAVTVTTNDVIPDAPTGDSQQTVCLASGATATVATGLKVTGTGIKWYMYDDSSDDMALLPDDTDLVNGENYYATQTINGCESSPRIKFVSATLRDIPNAPTGDAKQNICLALRTTAYMYDLKVTGTEYIEWYDAPTGGNFVDIMTALASGSTYYASQTAEGCESPRLEVTATVNAIPDAPTGDSQQTVCLASGATATVAKLKATGASIQWYEASTGGKRVDGTTTLASGSTYYASQTVNGCESTGRFAATPTLNLIPNAPTGDAKQNICVASGATATLNADVKATGTAIQWYAASTGGNLVDIDAVLSSGANTYYASQTVSVCESPRLEVTATVNAIPDAPTGETTKTLCSGGEVGDLTAHVKEKGTTIKWYEGASTDAKHLESSVDLKNDNTYYASQTVEGCESTKRFAVTVTVGTATRITAPPEGSASQSKCDGATVKDLAATGSGAIIWRDANTGGTVLSPTEVLADGKKYYASQMVDGCESNRLEVTFTVTPHDDAAFYYGADAQAKSIAYAQSDEDPTPAVTTPGGTFSSTPAGLALDGQTGVVRLSTSQVESYTLTYATKGECPSTATFELKVNPAVLSLASPAEPALWVSPVPTRGRLHVRLTHATHGRVVLRLSTPLGHSVWTRTATKTSEVWEQTIDLSALADGVYMLEVIADGQRWTQKVVKE